ncbi:MAG: FAD-binding protein [Adlercreutzia equolifaciens]
MTAAEAGKSVVMLGEDGHLRWQHQRRRGHAERAGSGAPGAHGHRGLAGLLLTQTFEGGDSAGDPALVRILADNALDAVHWMEDHGLVYEKEVFTAIGGLWQRGHAVEVERKGEQGGSYYVSCLMDAAQATGNFTLYTDAKIRRAHRGRRRGRRRARHPSVLRRGRGSARKVRGARHGRLFPQRGARHAVRQARDRIDALL